MARLTAEERRRMAKCPPNEEATAEPVRKFPPVEPDNWPHLAGYATPEELWAAIDAHVEPDFAAAGESRACDWCYVDGVETARPAAWFCQHCNLAMCSAHFEFLILTTDGIFGGRGKQ